MKGILLFVAVIIHKLSICLFKISLVSLSFDCEGKDNRYTKIGVADLGHLSQKIMNNPFLTVMQVLSILGHTEIRHQLSKDFRVNIVKQNGQVRKKQVWYIPLYGQKLLILYIFEVNLNLIFSEYQKLPEILMCRSVFFAIFQQLI